IFEFLNGHIGSRIYRTMDQSAFQIVVPHGVWRDALMPMLTGRELAATGPLLRDPARQPTGLLVEALAVSDTPRTGANFPALADWACISAPGGEPPDSPAGWIRRLKPRFAQLQ